jgi:hypothetical protein
MFKILKSLLLICIISLSIFASAQTIVVKKETARVKSQSAEGFEVELQSTYDEAESALEKQMKSFGKVKQVENYWVVSAPTIQGTAYTTPVYGITKQVGNVISIWVGLITSEWNQNDSEVASKDIESVLRSFGVNFHRDKIQKQIDESLRASQAVDRQQQRLANQNRDLNSKVEDNKREKIELEQSLVNNKIELETLLKKLEKNKKDQDSVAVAGEQVRKVVEMHRERQRKIN